MNYVIQINHKKYVNVNIKMNIRMHCIMVRNQFVKWLNILNKVNSFKSFCEKIYFEDKQDFLRIFENLGYQHSVDTIWNE